MNRSALTIGLVCASAALAGGATAQGRPQIRFTIVDSSGHHGWSGELASVSRDSLHLIADSTGRIAAFPRSAVRDVERRRWKASPGKAAGIGCLATGGALGALGYFGTHDPDSPGIEKPVGVISAVVGCGAGAIGGLVTSVVRGHRWEPWALPDSASYSPGISCN